MGGRIFERTGDGVEVRFVALGPRDTRIEIEHRGWERLGERADAWRGRNRIGWETLLPHLAAAI